MAVIDPAGLFNGRRLRRCSPMARLYWPYLFLLSNGYARIELDFDALAYHFASFRDSAPTTGQIKGYFEEYEASHLVLCYGPDGQRWAQWDTRRSFLKDFKTASDQKSPHPPEPEYSQWLQEQHGQGWEAYHWNKDTCDAIEVPAADAPRGPESKPDDSAKCWQKSGNISAEVGGHSPEFSTRVTQEFALGVGGGVGIGIGVGSGNGKGGGVSPHEVRVDEKDETPDDLPPLSLAMHIIEILCLPNSRQLLNAVTESIRTKAKAGGITPAAAHDFILLKAALAQKEGTKKPWPFWFSDQEYDRQAEATLQGQTLSPVAAPEPASGRIRQQLEAEREAAQKGTGGVKP